MQKKAQTFETLWWLINFFLLAVILISMLLVISDLNSSTALERKYIAKDIALLVNNLYASPNNVLYYYPENEFPFGVKFEDSQVKVLGSIESDLVSKNYFFVEDSHIVFRDKEFGPFPIGEYSGDETIFIPLGFRKFPDLIEPFSILSTADVLSSGSRSTTTGDLSYFEGKKDINGVSIGYFIVKAPLDPDLIVATKPPQIRTGTWSPGGKQTSQWARERLSDAELYAAINANFFKSGFLPRGIAGDSGNLYVEPGFWSDRAERYLVPGVFLVYEDETGNDVIDIVNIVDDPGYSQVNTLMDEGKIKEAVSGTPLLMEECNAIPVIPSWMDEERRPRTAVAVDREDNELFFIVVNGATGTEFLELIKTLELSEGEKICTCQANGCDVLNLDGGGSSTMVVNGERKFSGQIYEGGADERAVANHLGIKIMSQT